MGSLPIPGFLHKRLFSNTPQVRSLNINNINQNVVAAQYAVRGELAIKSEQYRAQLAKGEGQDLPFDSIISANIGNPQQLDQKPITFLRQVASIMENPLLLEHESVLLNSLGYKSDVIDRAKRLLKDVKSVGAYSQSQGGPGIRQSVADFIERRDGYPADPANIYLCAGASSGVNSLMNVICSTPQTGILVPIPQYPLYSATLSLMNAHMVPYYLNEESNWSTDVAGMRDALKEAQDKGIDVRAVVVINPGNPTGGSLEAKDISSVLEMAAEEKLVVLADEVYQSNVFEGEFLSFKKCLRDLQKSDKNKDGKFDNLELASLHSISKGMIGECGHRGGYYEMIGFDPEVRLS
jgi:alanine transaminase